MSFSCPSSRKSGCSIPMKTISAIVAISTLPDSISSTRRLTKVAPIPPPPSTVTEALDKCQTFMLLRAPRSCREDALRDADLGEPAIAVARSAGEDGERHPLPVALEQGDLVGDVRAPAALEHDVEVARLGDRRDAPALRRDDRAEQTAQIAAVASGRELVDAQ